MMKTEIGAYEAKTRLPELLRAVRAGKRFTITNRGQPIADLVPSEDAERRDPEAAIEKFRKFIKANPVRSGVNARDLIVEGRQ